MAIIYVYLFDQYNTHPVPLTKTSSKHFGESEKKKMPIALLPLSWRSQNRDSASFP